MPYQKGRDQLRIIRMAVRLHDQLSQQHGPSIVNLPEAHWAEYQRLKRLHEKAVDKGWLAAAELVRLRAQRTVQVLEQELSRAVAQERNQRRTSPLSPHELYGELTGLFEEFAEVDCDLRQGTISVVSEPVILEDIYLGPFRIELDLDDGDPSLTYSVRALDPHAAANDEEVTHPHIRDDCLCEGEGTLPINRGLTEGRLLDFFQIVCQVLHTYNPGSAYISLDEWGGIACVACGMSVCEDERTSCWLSSDPVCYECAVICPDCDHDFAPALAERCEECEEEYCHRCLEEGRCYACREKARQEEIEAEPHETETPSGRCSGHSAELDQTQPIGTALG